jgi:2-polyprenyl-6-methoxyphenol hydroxylase-like FAD-dependent oxidoreductase
VADLPSRTRIAIIGAGPTGLSAALALSGRGEQYMVVEKLPERSPFSRAAIIQARALEVLEELGVVDALLERGLAVERNVVRDRKRRLATIRLDGLPTRYPYSLMIPQSVTEGVLETALNEIGTNVYRGHALTDLAQDESGVTLLFDTGEELRADYVIGADGMDSRVREACGIGFAGGSYLEDFVLADVRLEWDPLEEDLRSFLGILAPDGPMVMAPLPGGRYRIAAGVMSAAVRPSLDDVQELLDTRGPLETPVKAYDLNWSSRFRAYQRHASTYRADRVFLAGDAAHVHSPAIGHGMNIGIQDGVNVARKLADVFAGSNVRWLDRYEAQRRPITKRVIMFTDRGTRVGLARSTPKRWLRARLVGFLGRVPYLRRKLAMIISELGYKEKAFKNK